MKKNKLNIFLVLLLTITFIALPVRAEEENVILTTTSKTDIVDKAYFDADEDISVSKDILGSSFIAGSNVTVGGNVDGILFLAGNSVKHNGTTSYAFIAGNTIEVSGTYEKDAAIAGNIISVRSEADFQRDVAIFGNEVTLSGVIERDVAIYGSIVNLENATIKGSAQIFADKINFNGSSKISGNLETNLEVEKKYVDGEITIVETPDIEIEVSYLDILVGKLFSYVSVLVTFVALFLLCPKLFNKTKEMELNANKVLSLCGTGLIFLVFVPVVSIFIMVTSVGMPISLITLAVYCISLYLSQIYTGYYIGKYLWENKFKKEENALVHTLIGVTIISVLALIPFVGGLVSFISLIIGLGLIVNTMKK